MTNTRIDKTAAAADDDDENRKANIRTMIIRRREPKRNAFFFPVQHERETTDKKFSFKSLSDIRKSHSKCLQW